MGKIYLSLEEDLNLLDLIRGQVLALEILMESHKANAACCEQSFKPALQVVQNLKKLCNLSEKTDGRPTTEQEASKGVKIRGNAVNTVSPSLNVLQLPTQKRAKTEMTVMLKRAVDARTPVQTALSNPLIVQKIMENVISKTLKSCRPVCKLWEEEATKQLLTSRHNQFFEVKFKWSENQGEYKHRYLGTLQAFTEFCLKKSHRFPCVQFHFNGGILNSPTFFNFFTEFGTHVKLLGLNPSAKYTKESSLAVANLEAILFKLAPNLESLALDCLAWADGLDFPTQFADKLPFVAEKSKRKNGRQKSAKFSEDAKILVNLKHLILPLQTIEYPTQDSVMHRAVVSILRAAPNLVQVKDEYLYFTREIVAGGKFGLIKHLVFRFNSPDREENERWIFFSEQAPELDSIKFVHLDDAEVDVDTMENCLDAILRSSQNTLKKVRGFHNINFDEFQMTPQFENVKSLKLKLSQYLKDGAVVPEGQRLVDFFPNVTKIKCADPKILEDSSNASTLVDSLVLTMAFTAEMISNAEALYPNLKLISLDSREEDEKLPETIKAICGSFSRLEKLEIRIEVDGHWSHSSEMDSAFTGLALFTCKELKKRPSEGPDDKILQSLEMNGQPSIRDLTKLKELYICLKQKKPNNRNRRLCTRVSELYAFDLMKRRQGLKVLEVIRNDPKKKTPLMKIASKFLSKS